MVCGGMVANMCILTCRLRGSCLVVQSWWLTNEMVIVLGSSLDVM